MMNALRHDVVLLDLISFRLDNENQSFTNDERHFHPGPALNGVTTEMAPKQGQGAIREYGRPEYERLIDETPKVCPLDADKTVQAFCRWDEEIGARRTR